MKFKSLLAANILSSIIASLNASSILTTNVNDDHNLKSHSQLNQINDEKFRFSLMTAKAADEYFSLPYADVDADSTSDYYSITSSLGKRVYRPNHSLAHGLRQAYLARDIALFIQNLNKTQHDEFIDQEENFQQFDKWLFNYNKESKFLQKLEFANSFQKSGRQSEVSREQNAILYESYLDADKENFQQKAKDHSGANKIFKDQHEVDIFAEAIVRKFERFPEDLEGFGANATADIYYLSKIFFTAHLLDLRRLPHFSKEKILKKCFSTNVWESKTQS